MEKVKELLEAIHSSADAKELLEGMTNLTGIEEIIGFLTAAAKKLGFPINEEELTEGVRALENERIMKTEQAEKEVASLSPNELDTVAGGTDIPPSDSKQPNCKYSFKHRENCWFIDGCDQVNNKYSNYICKSNSRDE